MKLNLNETEIKEYEEIFNFIENNIPDWEKVVTEGKSSNRGKNQNKNKSTYSAIRIRGTAFTKI